MSKLTSINLFHGMNSKKESFIGRVFLNSKKNQPSKNYNEMVEIFHEKIKKTI
jgi:hypothetical protein